MMENLSTIAATSIDFALCVLAAWKCDSVKSYDKKGTWVEKANVIAVKHNAPQLRYQKQEKAQS